MSMFSTFFLPHIFWIVTGIVLIGAEFFVPGFVIIFFGAGAILTGILSWMFDMADWVRLLIFALSSVGFLLLFRRKAEGKILRNETSRSDIDESCIGHRVIVVKDIIPPQFGQVELNGTNWSAIADENIEAGTPAIVIERNGLVLKIRK